MNDVAHAHAAGVDNASGRRLSFAFAKRHGVLVHRFVDSVAECIYRDTATPQALAEVRRYLRCPLRLCLLYTSDAADDMQCVDLGGRRIIKKKFFSSRRRHTR